MENVIKWLKYSKLISFLAKLQNCKIAKLQNEKQRVLKINYIIYTIYI